MEPAQAGSLARNFQAVRDTGFGLAGDSTRTLSKLCPHCSGLGWKKKKKKARPHKALSKQGGRQRGGNWVDLIATCQDSKTPQGQGWGNALRLHRWLGFAPRLV